MSQAFWKIMLRLQEHRNYHYAATKHSRQAPRRGEAVSVRDIDDRRIKAVIEYVRDEPSRRKWVTRVFTVQAANLRPDALDSASSQLG
jgi:hypothetical protein